MMVGQQPDGMANPEHLAKFKESLETWNAWRSDYPGTWVDLSGADLREADTRPGAHRRRRAILVRGPKARESRETHARGANLREANLRWADFHLTNFTGRSLRRANFQAADLEGVNLSGVDLTEANLTGVDLSDSKLIHTDLRGANLRLTKLMYADFRDADLRGADLTHQVDLSGADFRAAELGSADLSGAKLQGTDFRGASLFRANFSGAQFSDTDLTKAAVGFTLFSDVDLSEAKGLGEVRHLGPSSLGIDTIYRSKGKIPESFLRGAGVSDDFITYAKSLVANPIEFYSCFISYSTKDQAFADRLYADLQNKGVRCWFAPHDMKTGQKIHEQIDEAIRLHDKLLLILSPHGMESEWVKTEIAQARKREVRDPEGVLKRRVLFAPFETLRDWECFDADTGKDSAREIREYFIPDFSNWKNHDSYQEAFQRLISDLKASDIKLE